MKTLLTMEEVEADIKESLLIHEQKKLMIKKKNDIKQDVFNSYVFELQEKYDYKLDVIYFHSLNLYELTVNHFQKNIQFFELKYDDFYVTLKISNMTYNDGKICCSCIVYLKDEFKDCKNLVELLYSQIKR